MKHILTILILAISMVGCIHPKVKFRKARLLDPMMDPAKTAGFYQSLSSEPTLRVERGSADIGGTVGASCPTCGG